VAGFSEYLRQEMRSICDYMSDYQLLQDFTPWGWLVGWSVSHVYICTTWVNSQQGPMFFSAPPRTECSLCDDYSTSVHWIPHILCSGKGGQSDFCRRLQSRPTYLTGIPTGGWFPGVKRPERKTGHGSPSSISTQLYLHNSALCLDIGAVLPLSFVHTV
jgi:hypothetical protein